VESVVVNGGSSAVNRRGLLRSGAALAVGAVALEGLRADPAVAAGLTAVTAYRVKDYGAAGNGTTDDTTAIQSCLNAVPATGGIVWFDAGDYLVTAPLVPKSGTRIVGCHSPYYYGSVNPSSACKIRSGGGFTGGLIQAYSGSTQTNGVTLRSIALVGNNQGTGQHGIKFPDTNSGEQSWTLEGVTIAGFTGDGIHGSLQVATITGCYIHDNAGWGVGVSGSSAWHDVHVSDCFVFFNTAGGLTFNGAPSAAVDIVNCRVERSGNRPGSPLSPTNPNAPGINLTAAQLFLIDNCSTDANTGAGLQILNQTASSGSNLNCIQVSNCRFNRDGTGNQVSLPTYSAGVYILGTSASNGPYAILMTNCLVNAGSVDDGGAAGLIGPATGLKAQNALNVQWLGGFVVDGVTTKYSLTSVWQPALFDLKRSIVTLPTSQPSFPGLPDGAAYVDPSTSKLMVRVGGVWKGVLLS
jgi:hypothetical protein